LFWRSAILVDALDDLSKIEYEIRKVSCRRGRSSFYEQFSQALHWKEQFGYFPWRGNLDALNDGLRNYPFGSAGRSALVLDGFNLLANDDCKFPHAVLDIIEYSARDHLLTGKILLCLVQTDDNYYDPPRIGCRRANWNRREWIGSDRGC